MQSTHLGYLLTISSAAAFASASLFIKWAYALEMTAWSFTFANSIFTIPLLWYLLRREPGPTVLWPKRHRKSILLFALCGATSTIAFNLSLFHLSISLSTILLFTYPAFAALGAWLLLGHRPSVYHLGALFITLIGAALTANIREAIAADLNPIGIVLALLTGVTHGFYLVLGERVLHSMTAVAATTVTRIAIVAGILLFHPGVVFELPAIVLPAWGLSMVAAVFAGVAPFLLLNKGVVLLGANRAAIVSVAELPIALAFGLFLLGDLILPLQWAGALLIAAAVLLSQRPNKPGEVI